MNANAGVGAIGIHIYGEGFLRDPSFFDMEQKLVSRTINHNDVNPYIAIEPHDIQTLIALQKRHLDKSYTPPSGMSAEGQNDEKLANRIAELFNMTYDNIPPVNNENLTLGKLNYLIGFGMLEKFPESLAYVELANKSQDMSEIKKVSKDIKNGMASQDAFAQFGIDMKGLVDKAEQQDIQALPDVTAQGVASGKMTDTIQSKSLKEFAAHTPQNHLKR